MSGIEKRVKKERAVRQLYEHFTNYKQIILVSLEHVSSKQTQNIRKFLRVEGGVLVVGKNTVTKKAIQIRMTKPKVGDTDYEWRKDLFEQNDCQKLKALVPHIKGRVALIFTDVSVSVLKPKIEALVEWHRAKVGAIAPCDVTVPKGSTGLDPSEISFFHALKISTKIVKSKIEIQSDVEILKVGDAVMTGAAQLLLKLGFTPFSYNMRVTGVYDDGVMLDKAIISMQANDYALKFCEALKNINAVSMETGYHTKASLPSVALTGFKNILAMCFNLEYSCAKFEEIKNQKANCTVAVKAEEAVEAEPEKKSEKVNVDVGGMFGDSSSDGEDSSSSSD